MHYLRILLPVAARCAWAESTESSSSSLEARSKEDPNVDQFLRRMDATIAVLGDYLYISGGHVARMDDDDEREVGGNNLTFSVPLTQDWQPAEVEMTAIGADVGPGAIWGHGLWPDTRNNQLLSWGGNDMGKGGDGARDRQLWRMTPDGNGGGSWESEDVPSDFKRTTRAGYASCGRKGYAMGGRGSEQTDKAAFGENSVAVPGLVSYDFDSDDWANETTTGVTDDGSWTRGAAICVDMPDRDPKLFVLGGSHGLSEADALDFVYVHYWDPEGEEWLKQETAGERPEPRVDSCAIGINGPNGTYDFFLYSGWGGSFGSGGILTDAWILSIPAFRWFKAPLENVQARHGHACTRVGSQMIVVGGGTRRDWWRSGDTFDRGLGIMDLNSVSWKTTGFDADSEDYQGPKVVRDWYEKHGYDTTIWENDKVKAAFSRSDEPQSSPPSSGPDENEDNSSGDNTDEDSGSSSPDTAAIVGGVVGGVGALAIVGVLAWWFMRRRRRQRVQGNTHELAGHGAQYGPVGSTEIYDTAAMKYSPYQASSVQQPQEMDAAPRRPPAELP